MRATSIKNKFWIGFFILNFLVLSISIVLSLISFYYDEDDSELLFYYSYNDGPYLIWNHNPKSSMTIIWLTKEQSKTSINYGTNLSNLSYVEYPNLEYRHMVELKNLKANTTYYYQISTFLNEVYNFTTAPEIEQSFNFTVIGDTQNKGGLSFTNYSSVIEAMKPYDYDFILHLGDTIYSGSDLDSWHIFFDHMKNHATNHPYMVTIGNHEYLGDDRGQTFRLLFPYNYPSIHGSYYSFDYSNAHFVIIDCFDAYYNVLGFADYISDLQLQWLENELASNQDKWLFVALHAPPYSTGSYNMNEKLIEQLTPVFYKYKVDVVLSGHDHHYEAFWTNRTEPWGGTYYFVSGGGGGEIATKNMYKLNNPWLNKWHNASLIPYQYDYVTLNNQLYGELTHHFLHFNVNDTELRIKAIRNDGSLIQEFFIIK